jgi:CRISPR-associated protein Csm1
VAFAALLHDLGKLTERAGVFADDPNIEVNRQLYCPYHLPDGAVPGRGNIRGWFSHRHAADTALGLDALERMRLLPTLRDGEITPFAAPRQAPDGAEVTDSLINAAASHHRPSTFLQWTIAFADRVASGFERSEFEAYNKAGERGDHIRARLLVPFEEFGRKLAARETDLSWRYPLRSLTPASLFPTRAANPDLATAGAEYRDLWDHLVTGLAAIPESHRRSWPLWLDHFDSLWLSAAHAVPSASAFNTRPDVSLYDHSKTTAALAVAFWRYHQDRGDAVEAVVSAQDMRLDWGEKKLLLIQGEISGIQEFIFGAAAQTQKRAAKMLRGRSAMVALLSELAALNLLEALSLPSTSQIINAAGKFLIVAPNTEEVRLAVARVRGALDEWFLEVGFGLTSIALTALDVSPNELTKGFQVIREKLGGALERAKRQRFDLCGAAPADAIRTTAYPWGACAADSRFPAAAGGELHPWNQDQQTLGERLANPQVSRLLVFDQEAAIADPRGLLATEIFGYRVLLTGEEETTGAFGRFASEGTLRRAFDLSLPDKAPDQPIWRGYARRNINAYVPLVPNPIELPERYAGVEETPQPGGLTTFEHLACDDLAPAPEGGGLQGVRALGILKGDIDDLGKLFAATLGDRPTFAKWAALSRRVNAFFTTWMPHLCASEPAFRNIYTVFAGGDDFFVIGPWRTVRAFALRLARDFSTYCAENKNLHFSAGYLMTKPGHPLNMIGRQVEDALAKAKENPGKCAIRLSGETISWHDYPSLLERRDALKQLSERYRLSTAFLYDVLGLAEMSERADHGDLRRVIRPEDARWRALLHYRVRRDVIRRVRAEGRDAAIREIVDEIGQRGIAVLKARYRIVLSDHIYATRKA